MFVNAIVNGGGTWQASRRRARAFTLVEVLVAIAILGITFSSVIYAYVGTNDRALWSNYSLAAQSLATQGIEQVRAAKWQPLSWPVVDELGTTNFTEVETLDVSPAGRPIYATNYISITAVSSSPPIRQLRADCVWSMASRRAGAGPFTNTAVTFRTADE